MPLENPTRRPSCCAQRTRTAKRSGRLATASSACQTEKGIKTAKPGKKARGGKDRAVRRVRRDVQLHVAAFGTAAWAWHGNEAALSDTQGPNGGNVHQGMPWLVHAGP